MVGEGSALLEGPFLAIHIIMRGLLLDTVAGGTEARMDLLQVIAADGPIRHTAVEVEHRHLSDVMTE